MKITLELLKTNILIIVGGGVGGGLKIIFMVIISIGKLCSVRPRWVEVFVIHSQEEKS